MQFTEDQIRDILKFKDRISEQIQKHYEEIEELENNLKILDSILKQSSFTKASMMDTIPKPTQQDSISITGDKEDVIAKAYVTPEQVSIIMEDGIGIDAETPPFKSFFLDRIIGEMKKKDTSEAEMGKIEHESVIDYVINKNGSELREIIIKNYRQKERLQEIINTVSWSLKRMLENTNK